MVAVVDNDVALKSAQYLLADALGAQLAAKGPIVTLDHAAYVLGVKKPRPKITFVRPQEKQQLAKLLSGSSRSTKEPVDLAVVGALAACPGIDPGEVQLVAIVHENPKASFYTGDKRALVALARDPKLASVAGCLAGRCVHFEQCIQDLILGLGYPAVCSAIASAMHVDRSLATVFRELGATKEADALRRLKKSVDELRKAAHPLLR